MSSVPFSLLPFGRECGNTVVETQWLNRDQAVRPSTIFKYLPSPRFVRSNYSSNRAPFSDNNYIGAIVVVFSEFFYIVSLFLFLFLSPSYLRLKMFQRYFVNLQDLANVRSNYLSNRAPFSDSNYIDAIVFSEFFYIVSPSKLFTFENVCNDIS